MYGGGDGMVWWVAGSCVVVEGCDAVRSHLSELEISLNSECNFEYIPVFFHNC